MIVTHQARTSLQKLPTCYTSYRTISNGTSSLWQKQSGTISSGIQISSVKEGTPLKGLGIIKGLGDPIAKSDDQYPSWLWNLIEPGMGIGKSDDPLRSIRRELNKENRNKIRNANFLKGNK
ncbi:hypothetical protein CROQUDRAFT_656766 [Cronartium quercuum f. sp. fusiforme G11]|uniref:Large ribosomal subunit protein mL54 n=1 Tax=Cronartium quercuum f. sp. fusiforme G11 TaxID=708437 RepID=A0A9P6TCS6_9BASI|nr:hypothetical protein CROQUDRAFT_656766 [Cronartium quercuum f. sp. fusiforme G11]